MTLSTRIKIKWKAFMRDPTFYFDCSDINVSQDNYMLTVDFDQKVLFGKRLVHRKLYIMKNEMCSFEVRESITEIKKEVLTK